MTVPRDTNLKTIAIALALCGGVLAIAGLAYLFLTPRSYQARARLKVIDWVHSEDNPSDLRVIATECEMLHSNVVLDQAIQNLRLNETWGRRYHQGIALSLAETRERLDTKLLIEPVPDSRLIDIRVRSEDRDETAKIANELAQVYLGLRGAQRAELIQQKLGSLKQQWVEQSVKLSNAQASVDKLYFDISWNRKTNQFRVYDPDAYVSNRVEMEAQYIQQNNELAGLKRMGQEDLAQVLSAMDTNSALFPLLSQMNKAKSDLLSAKLDHGPDSREVKDATLVMERIKQEIGRYLTAALIVKEDKVAALKSLLDGMDANMKSAASKLETANAQYAMYTNALQDFNQLRQQRDDLEKKMKEVESKEAIVPASVTVELIDSAETPRKPYMPNGYLALAIICGGGLLGLAGLIVLLLSNRRQALATTAARQR